MKIPNEAYAPVQPVRCTGSPRHTVVHCIPPLRYVGGNGSYHSTLGSLLTPRVLCLSHVHTPASRGMYCRWLNHAAPPPPPRCYCCTPPVAGPLPHFETRQPQMITASALSVVTSLVPEIAMHAYIPTLSCGAASNERRITAARAVTSYSGPMHPRDDTGPADPRPECRWATFGACVFERGSSAFLKLPLHEIQLGVTFAAL